MKILFISEYFYPKGRENKERKVYKLAKALLEKKVEVHILTSYYKAWKVKEDIDGINVWRLIETKDFEESIQDFTAYLQNVFNFDLVVSLIEGEK